MQESSGEHFDKLRQIASDFPRLPGVYLMRDSDNETIYVGKARDLKARIKSYFAGGDGRQQIAFLMRRVHTLEKIITENEEQALILERDLITKYKPRYNIRLKDDKAYLNIRIDTDAEWPKIELVRKVQEDGATYFGPFTDSNGLRSMLEVIKNVVPLRTCSNTVFYNRQRPCLEYQIKRCAGPCCLPVDPEQYRQWVQEAVSILKGKTGALQKKLTERMERASENLQFEEAAILRDRLKILEEYTAGKEYVVHYGETRDVFGLFREGSYACLSVLKVRNGRVADSDSFSFTDVQVPDEEVVEAVITQYYTADRDIPEEIIVPYRLFNMSILREELKKRRGAALEITHPKIGSKFRLLNLARFNAEQSYVSRFHAEERYSKLSEKLALKFRLKQVPRRIECVDISNFQGSDIVGAVVSFFDGVPDKSAYRKYKISFSGKGKPDDFASILEVVGRRLKRGKEEDDLPDLLIIDGGPVQLAKALKARDDLGLAIEIISLAKIRAESNPAGANREKKPERVFLEGETDPIELEATDDLTHFMQRMRDEVHRFVITYHRSKRKKRVFSSALDDIRGVGPERRARLLKHFETVNRIRDADTEDIARAGRMPLPLAEKIKKTLQKKERGTT